MTNPRRASAKQPQDDLDALLSPGAPPEPAEAVEAPTEPVTFALEGAPLPLPLPADDGLRSLLLGWFEPLRAVPGRAPHPEMIVPFTVLLIAAVIARDKPTRTIHLDAIVRAFPMGTVPHALTMLHAKGFVKYTPIDGNVTIIKTPVEL